MPAAAPLLSICVPTFNRDWMLKRNLAFHLDAFRQCGLAFEIVVVDDCSTDDTPAYLESLAGTPELSVFRRHANAGRAASQIGELPFVVDRRHELGAQFFRQLVGVQVLGFADFEHVLGFGDLRPVVLETGALHEVGPERIALLQFLEARSRMLRDRAERFLHPRPPDRSIPDVEAL